MQGWAYKEERLSIDLLSKCNLVLKSLFFFSHATQLGGLKFEKLRNAIWLPFGAHFIWAQMRAGFYLYVCPDHSPGQV
jgi:hypothetical protein